MKINSAAAMRDNNTGKNKVLVELDEDDVITLNQTITKILEDGLYDIDDPKKTEKLKQLQEKTHEAFTLVRPS